MAVVPSEKEPCFLDEDPRIGTKVLRQRGNVIGLLVDVLWLFAKTLRRGNKVLCLLVKARRPRDEDL
jgi:hypothetical protein